MRQILIVLFTALAFFGCDCPDAPDTYKGARLSGCSNGSYVSCCSYDGPHCSYTLCQQECRDWYQSSWYCY